MGVAEQTYYRWRREYGGLRTDQAKRLKTLEKENARLKRLLTIIVEYTRECLATDVARKLTSEDMLERLSDLFIRRGVPRYLRSDNGPEFTAHRVRDWLQRVEVQTLLIEPGSPWENGYIESFNGKLHDELLCWPVSGSIRYWKRRCSLSVGDGISTPYDHTARWGTCPGT